MFTRLPVEQGSQEWLDARVGLITGTRAHQLLTTAATRKTLMGKILSEIDSGESADKAFGSDRMDLAHEMEGNAEVEYCFTNDCELTDTKSFIVSDVYRYAALSPDGFPCEEGAIEIKCLNKDNQCKWMIADTVDKSYLHQMEWTCFVTGKKWCDYVSLCPDLKSMRYWQKRFFLTDERRAEIEKIYLAFESELEGHLERFGVSQ